MISYRIQSTASVEQTVQEQLKIVEPPQQADSVDALLIAVPEMPLPPLQSSKRKILIVDDELKGPTRAQITRESIKALGDVTSEEYKSLLEVSKDVIGFAEASAKGTRGLKEFFGGVGLVEALTSPAFESSSSPELKALVSTFIHSISQAKKLRAQIESAFPKEVFDLTYLGSERPSSTDLLGCDLLLLDLVLQPSLEPVDEAKKYLARVALEAQERPLPPIIMMSNSSDLSTHKAEFSVVSKISAAGLLIIQKQELMKPDFGADGLRLTFRQLDAQRMAAHRMRIFIRAWTTSLGKASTNAEESLWNLDAPAMQQIHNTALTDNDPYDEHLNELVIREYLWNVESDSAVGDAVREMEAEFLKCFDLTSEPQKLTRRFSSPHFDPSYARSLLGHFTWSGWTPSGHFVDANPKEINKLMPFGAILIPGECRTDLDCYVHVTQQCDLNTISRDPTANVRSITFVTVKAVEVFSDKVTYYQPDQLVARGLKIADREFDFVMQAGRMMAMPLDRFISFARDSELHVQGRLRPDVASQFLQSAANNMTRPASQKMDRVAAGKAKLTLHGHSFADRRAVLEDLAVAAMLPTMDDVDATADAKALPPPAKVFDVLIAEGSIVRFPIASCFEIALWIKRTIEKTYKRKVSADAVCDALLLGLKGGTDLELNFGVKVKDVVLARAYNEIRNTSCAADKILLGVFVEKNVGELALGRLATPALLLGVHEEPVVVSSVPLASVTDETTSKPD